MIGRETSTVRDQSADGGGTAGTLRMTTELASSGGGAPVSVAAMAGDEPVQKISGPGAEQLLYFTSPSVTADGRVLITIADGSGHPNLRVRKLATGETETLTDNIHGFLQSYVYYDGHPGRGLGKASVSLDAATGRVYYLQGREIRCADPRGKSRLLARYPEGQITAFTHVSPDGRWLCVPTVDAVAFAGCEGPHIADKVRKEGLSSWLRIYDTENGSEVACERVMGGWVTHVQFCPADSRLLLYNHEHSRTSGEDRMWLWDGRDHRRLRATGGNRRAADWVCHEMWERDGSAVIYHGRYVEGPGFLGRVDVSGDGLAEVAFAETWRGYGHFTTGRPGRLVSDGYYQHPGDDPDPRRGKWISVITADWEGRRLVWTPLCEHRSSWKNQDVHPHPVFDPECRNIYFTSDFEGAPAVYRVACPR